MHTIKAVIFDYGGVIYSIPDAKGMSIFEALSTQLALDIEEFKARYFANNYRNNIQNWTHKQTLLYVLETFGPDKKVTGEALIDEFLGKRSLNEELIGHIKDIKAQGYTIALLSNYNSELRTALQQNGLAELFGENIFISTEIGCQKPDPKIFEHTFEKLGLRPEEVVFIDDSPRSLSTAEEVGYHAVRFIDNEKLEKDLQSFGIILS